MTQALCDEPMVEIARALRRRVVSSSELVDTYLQRIDESRRFKAFITVTGDEARDAAKLADRRLRDGDSLPLLGVPLAIKDLFATMGVRTTAGSRILRDWVPTRDATTVARLRAAGAVLLGKLNLHEFAYGITNGNPHWGVARNPWDETRIPGGSSGGSAIAVVRGMCAGTLGTDTGGSIRIPVALCGCVGLKPTFAAVPLDGVVPLAGTLDHAGPITRTVADARLLFQVIAGVQLGRPPRLRGLTVGVPEGFFFEQVESDILRRVRAAIAALKEEGLAVRDINLPDIGLGIATQLVTIRAEASAFHARWIRTQRRAYGPDVRVRLQLGSLISASDYLLAQRARERMGEALRQAFTKVDLLALPTVPIVASVIGERMVRWGRIEEPVDGALVRLTSPFNLTGAPALSVPCGFSRGLPVGLQLVARWGQESILLAAGELIERWAGGPQLPSYRS